MKASGLAGGKGVIVTDDDEQAQAAVDILVAAHDLAAKTILVEERLYGTEISVRRDWNSGGGWGGDGL